MEARETELLTMMSYQVANVYDLTISQLHELTAENQVTAFFTKRTETRSNKNGCWKKIGGTETVLDCNGHEVLGAITNFQFFIGPFGTESDWFVTEYVLDESYGARQDIPKEPVEYVVCVLEFAHQRAGLSSSGIP
ncbi:hypothetical protein EJ110_NYTH18780 [Nymphaea thermarum]|nr:hypothetical protein EJ110_NYTH18780 [Nymphaea thermarum]